MGVRDLSAEQLLAVLQDLLQAQEPFLKKDARTAAWLPTLSQDVELLRSTSRQTQDTAPEPTSGVSRQAQGAELDRRVEAAVQLLQLYFEAGMRAARARDQGVQVAAWQKAQSYIFDEGTAFLRLGYAAQVEATHRVLTLARDLSIDSALLAHTIAGMSFPQVLALIEEANQALADHQAETRHLAQTRQQERAGMKASFYRAQQRAQSNLVTLRRTARQALSAEDYQTSFTLLHSYLQAQS